MEIIIPAFKQIATKTYWMMFLAFGVLSQNHKNDGRIPLDKHGQIWLIMIIETNICLW